MSKPATLTAWLTVTCRALWAQKSNSLSSSNLRYSRRSLSLSLKSDVSTLSIFLLMEKKLLMARLASSCATKERSSAILMTSTSSIKSSSIWLRSTALDRSTLRWYWRGGGLTRAYAVTVKSHHLSRDLEARRTDYSPSLIRWRGKRRALQSSQSLTAIW